MPIIVVMADEQPSPVFEMDLGEFGDRLAFRSPAELRKWSEDEFQRWVWLGQAGQPQTGHVFETLRNFHGSVASLSQDWQGSSPELIEHTFHRLNTLLTDSYKRHVLNSASTVTNKFRYMVGRVTPCAPFGEPVTACGAHGVTRPTCRVHNVSKLVCR